MFSWHQIDLVPCCKQFESHLYLIVSVWVQRVVYWAQWSCDVKYITRSVELKHCSWAETFPSLKQLPCGVLYAQKGCVMDTNMAKRKWEVMSALVLSVHMIFFSCVAHVICCTQMIRNMQWTFYFVRSVLSVSALSSSKVILLCWFKQ